jgi:N utilization substance protein B
MGSRRKGREAALQMLYQWEVTREPLERLYESFSRLAPALGESEDLARRLLEGTLEHLSEIDALIEAQAEHWKLARMAAVDRNVLRLAIYEFLFEPTPKNVVINEALEVTRRFSSEEAVEFVNGILDGVWQRLEAAREAD